MKIKFFIMSIFIMILQVFICLNPTVLKAAELSIDPAHTAFIILHYQNGIVHPTKDLFGARYSKRIAEAKNIEHTRAVLDECRKKGVLVIHAGFVLRKGAPEISKKPSPLFTGLLKAGIMKEETWGAEFYDALKPMGNEPVVLHASTNCFYGTDLDIILRAQGITDVVMAGIATAHFVILATSLDASDRQYYPIVLKDCCNDESDEYHNWIIDHVIKDIAIISDSKAFISALRR